MPEGLGVAPHHVVVVAKVAAEGSPHINQPDGFGGNPEGARGALQSGGGGGKLKVLDGLKLHIYAAEIRSGEKFEWE